jgi:uncharacterized protein (DUF2345 family)
LGLLAIVLGVLGISLLMKFLLRQKETAFVQMLSQLEEMLGQVPQAGYGSLHPQQQDHILQLLMRTHTQLGQLNNLAQQRYDNQISGLMGMAANAGIDWTPPS